MLKRSLFSAALLLACAPLALAQGQANNCRLKHGSMVSLDAAACAMEGGAVVSQVAVPVAPAAPLLLSTDPKLAAAQQTVATLLMKPVTDKDANKRMPEWIARTVKFDGCRLQVDEEMEIEHGNAFSSRKHFKVSAVVDLRKLDGTAFGELGRVRSYGGGMETYAEYLEEPLRRGENAISISMQLQRESGPGKFTEVMSGVYWDAPDDDLWMVDEYGYPKDREGFGMATDKVRLLWLMNTPEDAAALHRALGEVRALCQR
ncbi:MAG: hypothetical protein AB1722_08065 [Pseudomonadota bacterium]